MSVVTFPINEMAMVSSVKSDDPVANSARRSKHAAIDLKVSVRGGGSRYSRDSQHGKQPGAGLHGATSPIPSRSGLFTEVEQMARDELEK
jgi:hypothetical protein